MLDLRQIAQMLNSGSSDEEFVEEEVLQLVGFEIGEEEFGVDIHYVKEIIELPEVTRVPKAPYYVMGVINLRGHIVPVVDLAKRFGLNSRGGGKVVVLEEGDRVVGIRVDEVSKVLRLGRSRVEPPHSMFAGIDVEYIEGIGKREGGKVVVILNAGKLLRE